MARYLHVLYVLRIQEGKAREIILIQVHHEHLVCGGEVNCFTGKLTVKVGHIFSVTLEYKI
jgi:hypothetical protein